MRTRILDWPRTTKRLVVIALDLVLALFATWVAFTLRFDTPNWPQGNQWIMYALVVFVLTFAAPEMFKMHQSEYQQLLSSLKKVE